MKLLSIIALQLLFTLLLFSNVKAQTGPGGVGSTDGTSNLVLWLDADKVSATDGSTVTSWADQSGYAYDYTSGNGAVYNSNVQNGIAAFSFNGSSHYFERAFTADLNTTTFSLFSVDNVNSKSDWSSVFTSRDDYPQRGYILYAANSSYYWQSWIGDGNGWRSSNSSQSTLNNWSGQTFTYSSGTTDGNKIYVNGALKATNTSTISLNTSKPSRIGAGRTDSSPSYFFKGYISEVIIYKTVVNSAQRIIIQNYLSAKYDYTLAANDKYAGDDAAKGDYDLHVIGIGTESDGSQVESNDGQGLILKQNSGFDNGDYLMAGNWAETNAANHTDVGGSIGLQARWNRIWYFDVTDANTAMTVDITFDFTDAGISQSPGTASNYKLIYRSGTSGDWSDAAASITPTVSGVQVKFSGVSISSDGYYTLGTIDTINSTLPIELIRFDLQENENIVEINWQTATEINNDFFTIERSQDAQNWESIARIKGAGNSNIRLSYKTIDNNPLQGLSYYRLKQTDYDGKFTYSAVRKVQMEVTKSVKIYPNPTTENITIEGLSSDIQTIRVYNTLGQEVISREWEAGVQSSSIVLDLANLPSGIYYIRIADKSYKVFKK